MWPICYQLSRKELCLRVSKSLLDMRFFPNLPAIQEAPVWSLSQEDSLKKGNDNPILHSCLENSMNRGAWHAAVHGFAELDMTEWLTLTLSDMKYKSTNIASNCLSRDALNVHSLVPPRHQSPPAVPSSVDISHCASCVCTFLSCIWLKLLWLIIFGNSVIIQTCANWTSVCSPTLWSILCSVRFQL